MDREITVPSFCNYTDLRQKQEVSGIEEETIRNYAKDLVKKPEQIQIFLEEVPSGTLMEAASRKYYRLENEDKAFRAILGK